MRRRRFLAGCLGAAAAPLGTVRARGARRAIVVSASVSLSGRLADFGAAARRGLVLWREQVDASGGLAGARVRLELADDGSDPEAARAHYERFAARSDLLVAPYGSRLTGAVLPAVERAGRPCVAPTAGDRALWAQARSWTAQLLNPSDTMLNPVVEAAQRAGAGSAAFLHRDDPFSRTVFGGAIRHALDRGIDVRGVRRYRTEAGARAGAREIAERSPELVAAMGFRPGGTGSGFRDDALMLLDALRAAGVEAPVVSLGIAAADPGFADAAGADIEGIVGTTGWRPYARIPGSAAFVERFRRRWGTDPDIHAAQAYAAGQVLAAAWRRAADGEPGPPAPAAVREALFALRTETVFGAFRVNERGLQIGKTNLVVQWQAGAPRVVWPQRYATDALQARFEQRAEQARRMA